MTWGLKFVHNIFTGFKMASPKLGCLFFSYFMKRNWRPLSFKSWHFEVSEDIRTKFKSQALHIIRIRCGNATGSGNSFLLIPALWNISTLRCQINESTRLSFFWLILDYNLYIFFTTLLALFPPYSTSNFFHPTCLFEPTCLWNLLKISTLLVYLALLV